MSPGAFGMVCDDALVGYARAAELPCRYVRTKPSWLAVGSISLEATEAPKKDDPDATSNLFKPGMA